MLQEFGQLLHTYLTSHIILAKTILPLIAEREGSSYLIITGGVGEKIFVPDAAPLTVAIAALYSAVKVLQFEWQDKPVRVNEFRIAVRVVHDEEADLAAQPTPLHPTGDFGRIIAGIGLASNIRGQTVTCYFNEYKEVLAKYAV